MQYMVLFLVCCSFIGKVKCDINPKWEHPHAWGKVQKEQILADDPRELKEHASNEPAIQENVCGNRVKYDVLEIYYLKLVNYLVSKDRFKIDSNSGSLKRHLTIEMTEEDFDQFAMIKNNVHAIDAKIFDILAKNSNSFMVNSFDNVFSVYEKIEMFISSLIPLEDLQFFALLIAFLLFVWQLSRVLKRNIIITFIGVIFLISYIFDYMKCCQEKEIDKLLELQNKSENPCQIKKSTGYLEFIAELFGKSPQDECKQHLMGNKKYFDKEYCDIFDHFIDFLVYKNFLKFIQKMVHIVKTITAETAFPYNIICLAVILFFLKDLLIAFVTSMVGNIFLTIFSSKKTARFVEEETAKIENKPPEPVQYTIITNINTKRPNRKYLIKPAKSLECKAISAKKRSSSNNSTKAIKAIENNKNNEESTNLDAQAVKSNKCEERIVELTSSDVTSSDGSDCDGIEITEGESIKDEIKVIKSSN